MKIYLVGGAVRDKLLGIPVTDRDWVVTGSTHKTMVNQGYKPVGSEFPVYLHPETHEEYALARTERKSGHGYSGFICDFNPNVTLKEDLSRRDLTINAIAEDEQGHLHDPYQGQADLNNRILRHVSPAFREDPLRVLRVARFHARLKPLGFSIHWGTLELMREITRSGELKHLTAERVWQELQRALGEPCPIAFFIALHDCSALAELFPELNKPLFQNSGHLERLEHAITQLTTTKASLLRWSSLFYDVPIEEAKKLCTRIKAPNQHKKLALAVAQHAQQIAENAPLPADRLLHVYQSENAFRQPERLQALLTICKAFAPKGNEAWLDRYLTALSHCRELSAQPLIAQGLKGKALGEALQQQRLNLIKTVLARAS